MVVHKFGGTSVANAERYRNILNLIPESGALVVSAMSKVTDALIELAHLAQRNDESYLKKLEELRQKHLETLKELTNSKELRTAIESDFFDLGEILRGVWLLKTCSVPSMAMISGYGEIWSAQLLNDSLCSRGKNSKWLNAREVLIVEDLDAGVKVLMPESKIKLNAWIKNNQSDYLVITGFVASTVNGTPTTLRRNGSDYSAALFGNLLDASSITIWTDVSGVYSADPRLVPEAVILDDLSYEEATELAYFGAKVVHPSTMLPAIEKQIPIWIRNSFEPLAQGTQIHSKSNSKNRIKGFSTIENVALLNIEGSGMMGVPGVAQRAFEALRLVAVSVVMISQASSENSICVAIPLDQAALAKRAIEDAFRFELLLKQIRAVHLINDCSILAAVGDNMVNFPGLAGRFLSALGQAQINIRAMAQGSSERNISVVVERRFAVKALKAVHAAFFLSNFTLSIGIIGIGGVGKALLQQLKNNSEKLKKQFQIDLQVRATANSRAMFFNEAEYSFEMEKFIARIQDQSTPHAVLVDCTSNQNIAFQYEDWLERGLHVVTPNKKANTADYDYYLKLKKQNCHYLYETTVGAGLPIINTLRELVRTGDDILKIEGVFSGTLSYIFNHLNSKTLFSSIVNEAKSKGFTEPDPREDLSGMDVARKLVILAREIGLNVELKDVVIDPLLPKNMNALSIDDFLKALPDLDKDMGKLTKESEDKNQVLRFVGKIDENKKLTVGLKSYPTTHAFSRLNETDNIVAFTTKRYFNSPLIVQGPGAGPEVTAAGIFADLLRLTSYLGAPI